MILYLGDTARIPYGTKSAATVARYAKSGANLLMQRGIKLLVVACNTASAYALEELQGTLEVPVLGVVEPGAHAALQASRTKRIGVIGTPGTIRSGQYQETISGLDESARVFCKACPLFVPLAEEGWTTGEIPLRVAETYLEEFREHEIDTLVLGCTHYPLLADVIQQAAGDSVRLVDSAESTARTVGEILEAGALGASRSETPEHAFFCTDSPDGFMKVGARFLGAQIGSAEWVDF
jgi:glutamate racemase